MSAGNDGPNSQLARPAPSLVQGSPDGHALPRVWPTEALEEARLLTNLETAEEKVLRILLSGLPELDEKLDSP
jgi:hypothetical protein